MGKITKITSSLAILLLSSHAHALDSPHWHGSSQEVVTFGVTASGDRVPLQVDGSGSLAITGGGGGGGAIGTDGTPNVSRPIKSPSATQVAVSVTTASTVILASNANRISCTIQAKPTNTTDLLIVLGATATAASGISIPAGSTVLCADIASLYTGAISALVASGSASAVVIEQQ